MKQDKLQIMGKLQPQAIDLERAVLGAIMISQYAFDKVSDIVKPNFFYNENHMKIYASMVELASKRLPIDLMTVVEMLKQKGELENVGGAYYVSCLTNDVVSDASIEYNSRIIAQKFVGRELIKISSEVLNNAYDETVDVFSLLDKSEHSIAELRIGNIKKQYKELSDIATKNIAHLENLRHRDIDISGVSSGFPELDMVTCGWQPSTLIILAARTSVGKTAFSLSLAKNATKGTNPVSVGIFSLEMQDKELVDRVISQESDVWLWRFKNGRLDDGNMNKIYDASNRLKKSKIFIDDTSGLTIEEFKVKARLMKRKENVGLIIIDYLQLMKSPTKKIREQEIAHISGELKGMSKELNIPIIALSQMSRDIEKGEHRKPKLSDLRECLSVTTSSIYTNKSFQYNSASPINLLSLHKRKLKEMPSNNIPKTTNNVFRLKTTTGRFIDCTANHEVLTSDGYKQLQKIKLTDSIAVAINWENEKGIYIPDSKFIGWMLGNGAMYGYGVPGFITRDEVISGLFCEFINQRFGFNPKWHPHYKSKVYQWDITNSPNGNRTPEGNIVTRWLKENDLWGKKSKDKYIPEWFMETANEKSICELLQGLWETDGSIALGKKKETISYSTTSLILAQQILYLTAKIGIICYLDNGSLSAKATTKCYKLYITSSEGKRSFIKKINLDGYKGEKLKSLTLTERQSVFSNILGRETTLNIESDLKKYSTHRFIQTHGARRLSVASLIQVFKKNGKDYNIDAVKDKYDWLISDSIYWDKVESIEAIGEVEIFDRSVPKSNNLVVNGIIVHNSGAIEQDADILMFLYRPSKAELDENAEMKQMFYLSGAKHRSGSLFDMIGKFTPENQKHHWLKIVDGNTNEPIKDIWTPVDLAPQKSFHDAEREEDPF